jgi:hypothetical protein
MGRTEMEKVPADVLQMVKDAASEKQKSKKLREVRGQVIGHLGLYATCSVCNKGFKINVGT